MLLMASVLEYSEAQYLRKARSAHGQVRIFIRSLGLSQAALSCLDVWYDESISQIDGA